VLSQLESAVDSAQLEGAWDWLRDRDLPLLVVVVLVVGPVLWVPVACLGYAVRWSGLTVTREQGQDGPTLRRVHGLLTRRATTLEEAKVRGVVVRRRALVGLAGGAELRVLTSGLDDNQTHLLPSAPRPVVEEAAIAVLGERAAVTQAVTRHGPRARRRQHLRHLRAVLVLVAATALSGWLIAAGPGGPWLWLLPAAALALGVPVGAATAELRYRRLGHAVTGRYLVSAAGTLSAARTALETDGIVGWRVRQSFWDRRLGLAQLTASTAAGAEYVEVRDVPLGEAVAIAASATPETLRGLTRPTCRVDPPRRSGPGQGPVTGSTAESSAAPRARRAP
jgi:putative membrane protein